MKRPSFQFYPADWRNNAKLRRCSWAARGAWIEVMGLLHDSDFYGILRWNLKEIALAIGCPLSLIKELVDKGVLKGCDKGVCEPLIYTPKSGRKEGNPVTLIGEEQAPIWFSSRMVRDEYRRNNSGAASRFTSKNQQKSNTIPEDFRSPRLSPSRRHGEYQDEAPSRCQSDGSTSSSSTTLKPSTNISLTDLEVLAPVDNYERRLEKPPDKQKRNVAIAIMLRDMGLKTITANHPQSIEWAGDVRVTDEILRFAVEKAALYKPIESISPAYLKPIVDDFLNPKKPNGGTHAARSAVIAELTGQGSPNAEDEGKTIECETRIVG